MEQLYWLSGIIVTIIMSSYAIVKIYKWFKNRRIIKARVYSVFNYGIHKINGLAVDIIGNSDKPYRIENVKLRILGIDFSERILAGFSDCPRTNDKMSDKLH